MKTPALCLGPRLCLLLVLLSTPTSDGPHTFLFAHAKVNYHHDLIRRLIWLVIMGWDPRGALEADLKMRVAYDVTKMNFSFPDSYVNVIKIMCDAMRCICSASWELITINRTIWETRNKMSSRTFCINKSQYKTSKCFFQLRLQFAVRNLGI